MRQAYKYLVLKCAQSYVENQSQCNVVMTQIIMMSYFYRSTVYNMVWITVAAAHETKLETRHWARSDVTHSVSKTTIVTSRRDLRLRSLAAWKRLKTASICTCTCTGSTCGHVICCCCCCLLPAASGPTQADGVFEKGCNCSTVYQPNLNQAFVRKCFSTKINTVNKQII